MAGVGRSVCCRSAWTTATSEDTAKAALALTAPLAASAAVCSLKLIDGTGGTGGRARPCRPSVARCLLLLLFGVRHCLGSFLLGHSVSQELQEASVRRRSKGRRGKYEMRTGLILPPSLSLAAPPLAPDLWVHLRGEIVRTVFGQKASG